jgi:hypothetical protein
MKKIFVKCKCGKLFSLKLNDFNIETDLDFTYGNYPKVNITNIELILTCPKCRKTKIIKIE